MKWWTYIDCECGGAIEVVETGETESLKSRYRWYCGQCEKSGPWGQLGYARLKALGYEGAPYPDAGSRFRASARNAGKPRR